ncbi:MAG: DUF5696 domain-containing protein [Capsulimonadaceae bacterium]|nr:DUF5696 domain-containing protein [Capsulimonadaceae bacterium]
MTHEITYFDTAGNVQPSVVARESGWTVEDGSAWNDALKLGFAWEQASTREGVMIRIPRQSLREEGGCTFKEILPCAGRLSGSEGDGGALVLPFDSGRLCTTSGKAEAEKVFPIFLEPIRNSWANMSIAGQFAGGQAQCAIIEGGKFDASLRVRTNWGPEHQYVVDIVFAIRDYSDDKPLAEDPSVVFSQCPGDWRAIAHIYRRHVLSERDLPDLALKAKSKADLDYSAHALTVRCRMGVKPVPCTIEEQTPETAPPVKVFLTFKDISAIADEFARQNVGAAEFCLVGWNYGGHDGAFPQIFPVDEAFGGEAELRKTIEHVKSLGYHISLHDNYYDGYSLARNFDMDDICLTHEGGRKGAGGLLGGGRAYRVCAIKSAEKYAPGNLPRCADLGVNGPYYIDVTSIISLVKCYSAGHPHTRSENAALYKNILHQLQDRFGVSMSEGARDWALPELDRAFEIQNRHESDYESMDALIPFYQIVYHSFVIYNTFREGINIFPGERLYLLNLAWGGLPMIYFHHLFHPAWNALGGWATDLTLETPEKLTADVAVIKRMTDDIARLAPLRYEKIEDIVTCDSGLTQTTYTDGSSVWTNFSDAPIKTPRGTLVPPMDFVVEAQA